MQFQQLEKIPKRKILLRLKRNILELLGMLGAHGLKMVLRTIPSVNTSLVSFPPRAGKQFYFLVR